MVANLFALLMARLPFDLDNEEGQGMAEYGLILALIAVALVFAFQGLKTGIGNTLQDVVAEMPGS